MGRCESWESVKTAAEVDDLFCLIEKPKGAPVAPLY